jgi:hypothetical protein
MTVSIVSWGALVAFTVLSIGGPLIGSGTFLGTDALGIVAPWTSAFGNSLPITNGMIGDTVDTVTPQAWSIVEAARHGVFAAWNPWVGGGTELGTLPNSGVYSPISIAWWVVPLEYAPGVTKLIEIAVSTLGMSLLLRRLGAPNAAWAIGSLVFVSSGFMIAWTNWSQTRVAAFIPLLFWALDRAAVARRLRDAVPVGATLAAMFLGGFPAVVGYALYAGGAYVVLRSLVADRALRGLLRAALVSATGVVLGGLLAAVALVPFAINATSVLDFSVREQTADSHLPLTDLATTVVAQFVGFEASGATWGDGSPIERLSYVGVVAVLLVLAAIILVPARGGRRPVLWYFVGGLALCGVLIYIGGPVLAAAQHLPIFSNNPIGRLRVMFGFFAAVAAALGFAAVGGRLLDGASTASTSRVDPTTPVESRRTRWARRTSATVVVLAIIVGGVVVLRDAMALVPSEYRSYIRDASVTAAWIGSVATIAVLVASFGRLRPLRLSALVVVPVLVAAPALTLADTWWPVSPTTTVYPATPALDYLADHLGDERYVSVDQAGFPGTNAMYGLRSVDGHAYQTSQWKDLLTEIDPDMLLTPTYSTLPSAQLGSSLRSSVLDRLGVRFALLGPGVAVPGVVTEELAGGGSLEFDGSAPIRSGVRTGPVRAVTVQFDGSVAPVDDVELTTDIVDATSGESITTTSTWQPMLSGSQNIAVDGDEIAAGRAWYAVFSIDRGRSSLLAAGGDPTVPAMSTTAPADDDLNVVHTGDATILERAGALQRVRWASDAVVETDPERRVSMLADPDLPGSTVVLEHPSDLPPGTAEPATDDDAVPAESAVTRVEDTGVTGDIRVETSGIEAGWVVFDDSLRRPGWTATIDGTSVPLLDAEHAGAAIAVPPGDHDVELVYRAPGLAAGAAISLATIGLLLLWWIGVRVVRRARRARRPGDVGVENDAEPKEGGQTTGV